MRKKRFVYEILCMSRADFNTGLTFYAYAGYLCNIFFRNTVHRTFSDTETTVRAFLKVCKWFGIFKKRAGVKSALNAVYSKGQEELRGHNLLPQQWNRLSKVVRYF